MEKSNWSIENIPNQKGKTIIITGASSGLGKEATRILAKKDASIIMAMRNIKKAEKVKNEILRQHPNADITLSGLDLSNLSSIKHFSNKIMSDHDQLDLLINNAGIMMCPYSITQDGFEIQMGTNHLGPFALTGLLMPLLLAGHVMGAGVNQLLTGMDVDYPYVMALLWSNNWFPSLGSVQSNCDRFSSTSSYHRRVTATTCKQDLHLG